ncbi:MAG: SAP domain-containing protein [Deltaproteobacteria bacterium]|nr:SAP domain-containing protein [Deltaproteobacteria bacterium]
MKLQEIRKIAEAWGVDARKGRIKQDIIRDIQKAEGYSPCFRTKDTCDENDCLWKKECTSNK